MKTNPAHVRLQIIVEINAPNQEDGFNDVNFDTADILESAFKAICLERDPGCVPVAYTEILDATPYED